MFGVRAKLIKQPKMIFEMDNLREKSADETQTEKKELNFPEQEMLFEMDEDIKELKDESQIKKTNQDALEKNKKKFDEKTAESEVTNLQSKPNISDDLRESSGAIQISQNPKIQSPKKNNYSLRSIWEVAQNPTSKSFTIGTPAELHLQKKQQRLRNSFDNSPNDQTQNTQGLSSTPAPYKKRT